MRCNNQFKLTVALVEGTMVDADATGVSASALVAGCVTGGVVSGVGLATGVCVDGANVKVSTGD